MLPHKNNYKQQFLVFSFLLFFLCYSMNLNFKVYNYRAKMYIIIYYILYKMFRIYSSLRSYGGLKIVDK